MLKKKKIIRTDGNTSPLGHASVIVKISIAVAIAFILVISVKLFMDYAEILEEKKRTQAQIEIVDKKIDELNYYIKSPMDEYYVRKFAKDILGLVPPDEDIFITGGKK